MILHGSHLLPCRAPSTTLTLSCTKGVVRPPAVSRPVHNPLDTSNCVSTEHADVTHSNLAGYACEHFQRHHSGCVRRCRPSRALTAAGFLQPNGRRCKLTFQTHATWPTATPWYTHGHRRAPRSAAYVCRRHPAAVRTGVPARGWLT